ncbi:MAG: VCBS repeat-containing protein [Gammaproteobacteria bacterium]|nr:VCBS repeat-containing protein [Gammaproteobacteria bacterium]MDH5799432.1 VCBS repeat-containing protein [Gammaproteobacteria bacterium]
MDGDGDLDVVSANSGQCGFLYRNDGGNFVDWQSLSTASGPSIALGDLDGDVDVLIGSSIMSNLLYLNK